MGELRFDVVVVGAGPAGLEAAKAAAQSERRVALVDLQRHPGGQIWRARGDELHPRTAALWSACETAGVEWLGETTIVDALGPTVLLAATASGSARQIRADHVVLATGARERLLPFPGWTLPGVVGAGGLQALVKSGLPLAGKRVLVAGSGPLLLAVAETVRAAGGELLGPYDRGSFGRALGMAPALLGSPSKLWQLLRMGPAVRPRFGFAITEAQRIADGLRVTLEGARGTKTVDCDLVACGDGLVPQTRLAQLLGCEVRDGAVVVDPMLQTNVPGVSCAGEPTGIGGEAVASLEGRVAGAAAAGNTTMAERSAPALRRARAFATRLEHTFALQATPLPPEDTMVCRCESVTLAQLRPHPDARTAKLQERCGMGACQGRVCSPALQQFLDWDRPSGRPPLFPTPLGVLTELWSEPNQCPNP